MLIMRGTLYGFSFTMHFGMFQFELQKTKQAKGLLPGLSVRYSRTMGSQIGPILNYAFTGYLSYLFNTSVTLYHPPACTWIRSFQKSKVQPPPLRGSVGLLKMSKVQPPHVGGSLGNLKPPKVHGGGGSRYTPGGDTK